MFNPVRFSKEKHDLLISPHVPAEQNSEDFTSSPAIGCPRRRPHLAQGASDARELGGARPCRDAVAASIILVAAAGAIATAEAGALGVTFWRRLGEPFGWGKRRCWCWVGGWSLGGYKKIILLRWSNLLNYWRYHIWLIRTQMFHVWNVFTVGLDWWSVEINIPTLGCVGMSSILVANHILLSKDSIQEKNSLDTQPTLHGMTWLCEGTERRGRRGMPREFCDDFTWRLF